MHRSPNRFSLAATVAVVLACSGCLAAAGALARTADVARNPCGLVTVRQIESITHRTVTKRTLAPLGPTCIYALRGAREITIVVESGNFTALARVLRNRTRVHVRSRAAYCGRIGQSTLYVSLASGKVLAVSAGCSVAEKIAAAALAGGLR